MNILKKIWAFWIRLGKFMGDTIGRILLTGLYFTLLVPFGLGVRIFGNPLNTKAKYNKVAWKARKLNGDLETSKNQY